MRSTFENCSRFGLVCNDIERASEIVLSDQVQDFINSQDFMGVTDKSWLIYDAGTVQGDMIVIGLTLRKLKPDGTPVYVRTFVKDSVLEEIIYTLNNEVLSSEGITIKPKPIYLKDDVDTAKPHPKAPTGVIGTWKVKVTRPMRRESPYITPKGRETDEQRNFMAIYNHNIPMPLGTMIGDKVKETDDMVYMKLHGDILNAVTPVCMMCGHPIKEEVSQYFGLGPLCGKHDYVNPFDTQEELDDAVLKYRINTLNKFVWEGWIKKEWIKELSNLNG